MVGMYPSGGSRKRFRVAGRRYLGLMPLWGLWVLATLINAALISPAHPSSLVLGLAAVAAALLIVALFVPALAPAAATSAVAFARRARTFAPPRLIDPDAAGRPRPRAPTVCPAA
jgi:hypothetical protein